MNINIEFRMFDMCLFDILKCMLTLRYTFIIHVHNNYAIKKK